MNALTRKAARVTSSALFGLIVVVLLTIAMVPTCSAEPSTLLSGSAVSASGSLTFTSTPVLLGSLSVMVTAAPEFVVIPMPSFIASGMTIHLGKLVPMQLIVSGASGPHIIPLNLEESPSLLQRILQAWRNSESSLLVTPEADESGPEVPASADETWMPIRSFLLESPVLQEIRLWGVFGLAFASVIWSLLLSHQAHQAARSMVRFPWAALGYGTASLLVMGLVVTIGRQSVGLLIVLALALWPLLPLFFLAPAVAAAGVGLLLPGALLDGRVRPALHVVLVVAMWFTALLPVVGLFLFMFVSLWGLGGLMLAVISPNRESENSISEVVS